MPSSTRPHTPGRETAVSRCSPPPWSSSSSEDESLRPPFRTVDQLPGRGRQTWRASGDRDGHARQERQGRAEARRTSRLPSRPIGSRSWLRRRRARLAHVKGFNYSNRGRRRQLRQQYLAAHPEYTPPQPRYVGDQVPPGPRGWPGSDHPGSVGAWRPRLRLHPGPGDMLNPDPYALPELAELAGGHIHGSRCPRRTGSSRRGNGLLRAAIGAKLSRLQNPPPPAPTPAPAPPAPVRSGGAACEPGAAGISKALTEPSPGVNLGAPAVNTALTAEQQRALLFQGEA